MRALSPAASLRSVLQSDADTAAGLSPTVWAEAGPAGKPCGGIMTDSGLSG